MTESFPFDLSGGAQQRWASLILTLTRTARVHLLCFQSQQKAKNDTADALQHFINELPPDLRQQLLSRFSYDCVFEPKINLPPEKRLGEWFKTFWTKQPFLVWQYHSTEFQQLFLARVTELKPKTIHLGHLRLAQFLPRHWLSKKINKKTRPRLIYEAQNIEWQLVKSQAEFLPKFGRWHWWWRREIDLTKTFEKAVINSVDYVFTLCEPDLHEVFMLKNGTTNTASVLPIFYPALPANTPPMLPPKKTEVPSLVFIGNLEWLPNADALRWFLTEIWPNFAAQFPTAKLTVVGKPCSYLSLTPNYAPERVRFTGYLPKIEQVLSLDCICILPFRMGSGVRLKALEAAWYGAAIVSTPLGVRGLELTTEKNCLIGDTAQHFEHQLVRAAYDVKLRDRLGAAAQAYVMQKHTHVLPKKFWRNYWGKSGLISTIRARVKTV